MLDPQTLVVVNGTARPKAFTFLAFSRACFLMSTLCGTLFSAVQWASETAPGYARD